MVVRGLVAWVVAALVCGFAAGCGGSEASDGVGAGGVELLKGRDWAHFAGAQVTDAGVHVSGLGRVIVAQDGSGGQPNPPVNLRGPRLDVHGDFDIQARIRGVGERPAYLQLYGEVPVIYDEWRQERRSVRIGVDTGGVEVALWDGSAATPGTSRWVHPLPPEVELSVRRVGDDLEFRCDGVLLGTIAEQAVFGSGQIRFGADAAVGDGWDLTALRATSLPGGSARVSDALVPDGASGDGLGSLAVRAGHHLAVGAAVASAPLFSDQRYRNLVVNQFSMLTPENDMKPRFLHPQPAVYDFTESDALVEFADANRMTVHGHTLVFGEALPPWMRAIPAAGLRQTMIDHVTTVAAHFRGRVAEWDVVNEPLSVEDADYADGKPALRQHMWQQAMGEDYIDTAFRAARSADPQARLYLNEFGAEADGPRWDALLALVTRLFRSGVPLDGVGFQAHIHEESDRIDERVFARHIDALAALGLRSRVSEIDVHGEDPDEQAEQLADALSVCLSRPTLHPSASGVSATATGAPPPRAPTHSAPVTNSRGIPNCAPNPPSKRYGKP